MHESDSGDHVVASSANQNKPTQFEMENASWQIQHETSNIASTGKDCIPPETSDSIPCGDHKFANSKDLLDLPHTEIDKAQSVNFEPVSDFNAVSSYIYPHRKVGEFDLQSMRQNLEKKSELREKATEANNTSCTHSIFTVVTQQEDSVPADERTISSDQESDA